MEESPEELAGIERLWIGGVILEDGGVDLAEAIMVGLEAVMAFQLLEIG